MVGEGVKAGAGGAVCQGWRLVQMVFLYCLGGKTDWLLEVADTHGLLAPGLDQGRLRGSGSGDLR